MKGKTHDSNHDVTFSTHTNNCGQCLEYLVCITLNKNIVPTGCVILWHTQLIVCAENVKSWFKLWVFPFTFQAYILPHTLNCKWVSLSKFHIWILKQFLTLPKTASSTQTHKSKSFIWIVWSTLYAYLWMLHTINHPKWSVSIFSRKNM